MYPVVVTPTSTDGFEYTPPTPLTPAVVSGLLEGAVAASRRAMTHAAAAHTTVTQLLRHDGSFLAGIAAVVDTVATAPLR